MDGRDGDKDWLGPTRLLYPPLLLDANDVSLPLDVTEGLLLDVTVGNNNQQRGQNTYAGGLEGVYPLTLMTV